MTPPQKRLQPLSVLLTTRRNVTRRRPAFRSRSLIWQPVCFVKFRHTSSDEGHGLLRDSELAEWYQAHKAADKRRKAREAVRLGQSRLKAEKKKARLKVKKAALAKLTEAEKKALGL